MAESRRAELARIVSTPAHDSTYDDSPGYPALRARWGLPRLDTGAVRIVTNRGVCARALGLYARHFAPGDVGGQLVVVLAARDRRFVAVVRRDLGLVMGPNYRTLVYDRSLTRLVDVW